MKRKIDFEKLFSVLCNAQMGVDSTLTNGKKTVTVNAMQAKQIVQKSLTAHFAVPTKTGSLIDPGAGVEVDKGAPVIDGINAAFKPVTLGPNRLSWQISGVEKPFVFEEIAPGGTIKFNRLYGKQVTAYCKLYGVGLDVPFDTLYEKNMYQFLEGIEDAMDARDRIWADVHYGLLKKAATEEQAYSVIQTTVVNKDVLTINAARNALIDKMKGKAARPLETMLVCNCHFALESRIKRALKTLIVSNDNDEQQLTDRVQFYFTETNLDVNTAILSFPFRKSQNSMVLDAKQNTWENNKTNGVSLSVYTAFGAAIGDPNQLVKINFA